jgi:hypothetical protein
MHPSNSQAIALALGFSPADLAANRAGRLSPAQAQRMRKYRTIGRAGASVVGLIALAFIGVIAFVILPQVSHEKGQGSSSAVPIVIGVAAAIALIMTTSFLRTRRSLNRLVTGQVERAEGAAATRVHRIHGNVGDLPGGVPPHGGGDRYELTIGGIRFIVKSRAVLSAFQDGQQYCGYYVGQGLMATLLSAEPSPPGTAGW